MWADRNGLDLVWFTEHHFVDDGYLPSWVPVAAAAAAQTSRVRFSTDICLLPFNHPVRLIANALGTAPPEMIAAGKKHGIPVAALVGAKEHALKQVEAGVDVIVAQGGEPGVGGTECDRIRHSDGPGYLFLLKSSGSSDICSRAAVESEISWRRRTSSWNSVTSWKLR